MTAPIRVCFHAPLLWPLWSDGALRFAGGAEVQQARLARGLVARGFEITVVTCDHGQPSPVVKHGVRVLKSYAIDQGLPGLRFFHPRLSRTMGALFAADADVYYARGAALPAGQAYDAARWKRAAFVFGAAHDHDAFPALPELRSARDRWWYRRALRGAHTIIAQSSVQQRLFRENLGMDSTLIRNLVEPPVSAGDPGRDLPVVWLATYKAAKRPEWFLELARALPQRRFIMCGVVPAPPESAIAWIRAQQAARELPNLELRGTLEQSEVATLFQDTALFVHTSPAEGFPNTVLEAWAAGIPSVTTVDPDGVVARERCGEVVATPEALITAVRAWMDAPERRRTAGARARAYAFAEHSPDAVLTKLGEVFRAAAATRGRA